MDDASGTAVGFICVILLAVVAVFFWFRTSRRAGQDLVAKTAPVSLSPVRLEVGAPGNPALSLALLDRGSTHDVEPLRLDHRALSKLSPLFQHAPALATNIATATATMYELSFSPEVMRSLEDGSLALKSSLEGGFRAMAENDAGNIVAHGSLHPMDSLSTAAAAAAAWQVLTIAVAQKHLADINAKLESIVEGIESIKQWLQHDQRGKLEGNLVYLSSIGRCFLDGSLSNTDLQSYRLNLEEVGRETLQLQKAIEFEFDSFTTNLARIELNEWGTKKDAARLREQIVERSRLAELWLLALHVRAVACQLACALPGDQPVARGRLAEIAAALHSPCPWDASRLVLEELVSSKLDSIWTFEETLNERRRSLIDTLRSLDQRLTVGHGHVGRTTTQAAELLSAREGLLKSGIKLAVVVDNAGNVVSLGRVHDG